MVGEGPKVGRQKRVSKAGQGSNSRLSNDDKQTFYGVSSLYSFFIININKKEYKKKTTLLSRGRRRRGSLGSIYKYLRIQSGPNVREIKPRALLFSYSEGDLHIIHTNPHTVTHTASHGKAQGNGLGGIRGVLGHLCPILAVIAPFFSFHTGKCRLFIGKRGLWRTCAR